MYVGSPAMASPTLVFKQRPTSNMPPPAAVVALADGTCVGVPAQCTLLVTLRRATGDTTSARTPWSADEIDCIGVVCWAFIDRIVRVRVLTPEPASAWTACIDMQHAQVH
jgi:hypothetical protein